MNQVGRAHTSRIFKDSKCTRLLTHPMSDSRAVPLIFKKRRVVNEARGDRSPTLMHRRRLSVWMCDKFCRQAILLISLQSLTFCEGGDRKCVEFINCASTAYVPVHNTSKHAHWIMRQHNQEDGSVEQVAFPARIRAHQLKQR